MTLRKSFLLIFFVCFVNYAFGQSVAYKIGGIVSQGKAETTQLTIVLQPLAKVSIINSGDNFLFTNVVPGNYTLEVYYQNQKVHTETVSVTNKNIDNIIIDVTEQLAKVSKLDLTSISFAELEGDESTVENIAPLLQSSFDTYSRIMAFQWGNYFVNARGLDSRYTKVLINGIEMNNPSNGRPVWRSWGGLNDIFRYPERSISLEALAAHQGSLNGIASFNTEASKIRKRTNLQVSLTNRNSYQYRVLGSYATGLNQKGWAFAASASARLGGDPLFSSATEGGFWNAYSFFFAAQKIWNTRHSLNLSLIGAYNQRGATRVAMTKEVRNLFGNYYNPYWGFLGNKKRNERVREDFEPIMQLNYRWNINEQSSLMSTFSVQVGSEGNTRLNRYNQPSASPIYYRYLPSYSISEGESSESAGVYNMANNYVIQDAQINWKYIYDVNRALDNQDKSAGYAIEEQRNDVQNYALNVLYKNTLSSTVSFSINAAYQYNIMNQYSSIYDLLGATYLYNVDVFNNVARNTNLPATQRLGVGDRTDYDATFYRNYTYLNSKVDIVLNKLDITLSGQLALQQMQRKGNFSNPLYGSEVSFGKSEQKNFLLPSLKLSTIYKLSGKHFVKLNAVYEKQAPSFRTLFPNGRYENTTVTGVVAEQNIAADVSYIFRFPKVRGRATFFAMQQFNLTNVQYFFLQSGELNAFVTEVTNGIETQSIGGEFAVEFNIVGGMSVTTAVKLNQNIYTNNPNVTTLGQRLDGTFGIQDLGETLLKNTYLPGDPQQAYHIGINYSTATYWRFGLGLNYLDGSYISISSSRRTKLFSINPQTNSAYANYTEAEARELLRQEKLNGGFYANLFISKSWKIQKYILGFQFSVNNLTNNLDLVLQGFEQSRYPSFPELREEANRGDNPIFGNRYWYNQGVNFFLNLFVRF